MNNVQISPNSTPAPTSTNSRNEVIEYLEHNFREKHNSRKNSQKNLQPINTDIDNENIINLQISSAPYVLHQKAGTKGIKELAFDIESAVNPNENAQIDSDCELVIILDVSGSMHGAPLDNCKTAILEIVDRLPRKTIFHLVTYHTTAQIEFRGEMNEENKQKARSIINDVTAKDCTNIIEGVKYAIQSLYSDAENYSVNRRIFIFSDGDINEGVQEPESIFTIIQHIQTAFAINFTSFGLGADFNENVMKGIAHEGKGDYFFIDGPEDVSNKVQKALHVFGSLYAINAHLKIEAISSNYLELSIAGVSGFKVTEGASDVSVTVGDICYDDLRQVLVFLNITTQRDMSLDPILIAKYSLEYQIVNPDGSVTLQTKAGEITVEMTEEQEKVQKPPALEVALEINNANKVDKELLALIDSEDYDEAIRAKTESIEKLTAVLPIDKTGVINHLIKRSEATIESLRSRKESVRKDVGYLAYQGGIVHRKCF